MYVWMHVCVPLVYVCLFIDTISLTKLIILKRKPAFALFARSSPGPLAVAKHDGRGWDREGRKAIRAHRGVGRRWWDFGPSGTLRPELGHIMMQQLYSWCGSCGKSLQPVASSRQCAQVPFEAFAFATCDGAASESE